MKRIHKYTFMLSILACTICSNAKNADTSYPRIKLVSRDTIPIDKSANVADPLLVTSSNDDSRPTSFFSGSRNAVGKIDIESDVSPSGAKLYTIPLKLPQGMNGFVPELAIKYNSQQGDGVMTRGWSLGGLSVISRVPKTIYYDNVAEAVENSLTDAFTLDGVRLIYLGAEGLYRLYETEYGNIKVKGSVAYNNIERFEVYYPDGKKGVFETDETRFGYVHYPVTSFTDLNGNTMTFTYLDNYLEIESISYNGNVIEFIYEDRIDTGSVSCGGFITDFTKLLRIITCRYNDYLVGRYKITYDESDGYNNLVQIDYSSLNKTYNGLKFIYNQRSSGFLASSTQLPFWFAPVESGTDAFPKIMNGKFDYEGGMDGLVMYPNYNPYWFNKKNGYFFENLYDGTEDIVAFIDFDGVVADNVTRMKTEAGFIDMICADLAGTQEENLIKVNNVVDAGKDKVIFTVYGKGPSQQIVQKYKRSYSFPTVIQSINPYVQTIHPKFYYPGDFNGDGKMEILAISVQSPMGTGEAPSQFYIFDLENDNILYHAHLFEYHRMFRGEDNPDESNASNNSDRIIILDYNGDGKTDICHVNQNGTSFYTFEETSSGLTAVKTGTNIKYNRTNLINRELIVGDYNGDGLADLALTPLCHTSGSNNWSIWISQGDGNFRQGDCRSAGGSGDPYLGFMMVDINGNGKTDLIRTDSLGFSQYRSIQSKFERNGRVTKYPSKESLLVSIDINSHNNSMLLVSLSKEGGVLTKYRSRFDESKDGLVSAMINSFDVIEHNNYKHILNEKHGENWEDDGTETYVMGAGAVYPYIDMQERLAVLSSIDTYYDNNHISKDIYTYRGAIANRHGLGFCGFEKVTMTDIRNRKTIRTYDPYKYGVMTNEDSDKSETIYFNDVAIDTNRIVKATLQKKSERDKVRGIEITTSYEYDSYGFPVKEQVVLPDNLTVSKEIVYSHSSSVEEGYNLGFPVRETITTTRDGNTYSEGKKIDSFSKRHPLIVTEDKDGNITNKYTFSYDSFGNLLSKKQTVDGSEVELITSYQYDSRGNKIKEIDIYGHSEYYEYDQWGRISSKTDFRDNKSNYRYNGYDDNNSYTIETYADGTSLSIKYNWVNTNEVGKYKVKNIRTGKQTEIKYYDAFEREVRTSTERFDGTYTNVDKVYDDFGRLEKVSLPFKTDGEQCWNTYEYDRYDQLISIREASGRITSYGYIGMTKNTYEDDVLTKRTYDALDNLIKVEDPAGVIEFTLAADGQPISVSAPGGIKTSLKYDAYRRKTSITDPSQGTIKFTYDGFGNILTRTNANNKTTTYEYDSFNRLVKKSTPELTATYTYDANGDLTSITGSNGTSMTTEYDEFGRKISETEYTVDSYWLKRDYTYDKGNLACTRYTYSGDNSVTERYQYSNGHLREVLFNDSISIYRLVKENSLGRPIEIVTGLLTRKYGFDEFGYPTSRTVESQEQVYQDIKYEFDALTSNLMSRETNGRLEEFSYDDLNRLTSFGNYTVSYDVKGNILKKSDVGQFLYESSARPYRITSGYFLDSAIPGDVQKITYSSFDRPLTMTEGDYSARFEYKPDYSRVKMKIMDNTFGIHEILTRHYLGDCLELDTRFKLVNRLYLNGDYYSSPVIYYQDNRHSELLYILRDYQGSITHVIDADGNIVQRMAYDPWGRLCNPDTGDTQDYNYDTFRYIGRGYTGHEHLPEFGLINMNARLYNPQLGRFVSPDPMVQAPDMSQNFNRYTYALNNPFRYKDPNGEFFIGTILTAVIDFFKGLFTQGVHFNRYDWRKTRAAWRLDKSMFKGNFGQVLNKWTYNSPLSAIGNVIGHATNMFGTASEVTYLDGMAAVGGITNGGKAFTVGHYSFGPDNYRADWRDHLFVHEYGHYIQAQRMGWSYISLVGLPSLISCSREGGWHGVTHDYRWFEQNASKLGAEHFDKHYGSGADGYDSASEHFFDKEAFIGGKKTIYINPRTLINNTAPYPIEGGTILGLDFMFILII